MITVYSRPGCPPCDATYRTLDKLELEYVKTDITVDSDARQRCVDLGYSGTPVVVAGEDHWTGFRPDRLKALVG